MGRFLFESDIEHQDSRQRMQLVMLSQAGAESPTIEFLMKAAFVVIALFLTISPRSFWRFCTWGYAPALSKGETIFGRAVGILGCAGALIDLVWQRWIGP